MAMSKPMLSPFGISAVYWRVGELKESFHQNSVEVLMYGYPSRETRLAGGQPIALLSFRLEGDKYIVNPTRAQVYDAIKADSDEFEGAEDC
jgi:hypothetical protein